MSTGADNRTMPVTKEYEDGYERIFGKREPVRGTWVQDPVTGEMVPIDQYVAPQAEAKSAPIMVDRFYENTAATDGTDIGSRRKHREYMKEHGLTTADDYTESWKKAAKEREKFFKGDFDHKARREEVGRIAYELQKGKNGRR